MDLLNQSKKKAFTLCNITFKPKSISFSFIWFLLISLFYCKITEEEFGQDYSNSGASFKSSHVSPQKYKEAKIVKPMRATLTGKLSDQITSITPMYKWRGVISISHIICTGGYEWSQAFLQVLTPAEHKSQQTVLKQHLKQNSLLKLLSHRQVYSLTNFPNWNYILNLDSGEKSVTNKAISNRNTHTLTHICFVINIYICFFNIYMDVHTYTLMCMCHPPITHKDDVHIKTLKVKWKQ